MIGAAAADGAQKGKKNRWLLWGVGALVVLALTFLVLFSHRGLYRIYRLRQERQAVEQENTRLATENARLARTIDRLQHDPEYIQDRIRQELNFVKKNELIFQFPPDKPGTATHLIATATGETPPPARVQTIAERKVGTAKLVSGPPEGSSKKKASRRRE